jgi:hypothetical protein
VARPQRLTLALPAKVRQILELRGARPDTSHGPFNYTRQATRLLQLYEQNFVASDPRATKSMSADDYEFVLELLTDPLTLETFHIERLGDYLAGLPAFKARARQETIDPDRLRTLLNAYSFSEKLHLVDAALVRTAKPKSK